MNQPWIYIYSPSQSPLPPPSLPDPSGSSQCTRPEHLSHASNMGWNNSAIITIILNSFSGRFPISSSLVWFGGHFSCSFTCCVFLCLFILFRLRCLGWPFCILVVCGSSLLWRFLPVGGVGRLACQGFLVREACISVLVGGAGFVLPGVHWSVQ